MVKALIKFSEYFAISTAINEIQIRPEPMDIEISKDTLM